MRKIRVDGDPTSDEAVRERGVPFWSWCMRRQLGQSRKSINPSESFTGIGLPSLTGISENRQRSHPTCVRVPAYAVRCSKWIRYQKKAGPAVLRFTAMKRMGVADPAVTFYRRTSDHPLGNPVLGSRFPHSTGFFANGVVLGQYCLVLPRSAVIEMNADCGIANTLGGHSVVDQTVAKLSIFTAPPHTFIKPLDGKGV